MQYTLTAFSDEPILLHGLDSDLRSASNLSLVFLTSDLDRLVDFVSQEPPNVLLFDVSAGFDIGVVRRLRRAAPACGIVLWVRSLSPELAYQAIEAGIRGVLARTLSSEQTIECLQSVAQGELWLDRSLTMTLLTTRPINLTPRESQLIDLLSRGLKNKEIATALNISEGTVKVYLSRLFEKVGAKDRFELALVGLRNTRTFAVAENGVANAPRIDLGVRSLVFRR